MVVYHTKLLALLFIAFIFYFTIQVRIIFSNIESHPLEKTVLGRLSHKVSSKCKNLNIQFTDSEVREFWNYKNYTLCPGSASSARWEKGEIFVNCQNESPLFHADPSLPQKLGGQGAEILWTKDFILQPKSEYFIVKCSNNIIDHFAFVFNKFDPDISEKASKKSQINQSSKNFTVLLLLFDSVSRFSAYNNWPLTMNYLNTLNQSFNFFDFSSPVACGVHTRPNLVPIIYGHSEEYQNTFLGDASFHTNKPSARHLALQKSSIWSYYSDLGYTTMFLYDTVFDFMVRSYGRDIEADHVFVNFWKTVWKVFGFHDFTKNQRCIGSKDSHYYSLDYTAQYLKNYYLNNRFAYVHLDAAHENTGNVRTVDKDLILFLKDIFQWYEDNGQDIVIFLLSDHGRVNPNLQFNVRGYLDQRTPMTFIISSQGVTNTLKNKKILNFNQKELVGRYDINLSLKDIAHFPFTHLNESEYESMKKQYSVDDVVSLFREKINKNRNCIDIGVSDSDCTCKDYKKVKFFDNHNMKIVKNIFEIGIKKIKIEETFDGNCEKVYNFKLIKGEKYELMPFARGWDSIFKVYFWAGEMKFRVIANFCTVEKIEDTENILPEENYPVRKFWLNGTEVFVQLAGIKRLTKCERQYCICQSIL